MDAYNNYHKEKELVRAMQTADKENPNVAAACFDLEAVLSNPSEKVNAYYYKSKLATYNITLYELNSTLGH
jgi:hypothetical protein